MLGQVAICEPGKCHRRAPRLLAAVLATAVLVGCRLSMSEEAAPASPEHGGTIAPAKGQTVRNKEYNFSFVLPEGFKPVTPTEENLIHEYVGADPETGRQRYVLAVEKLPGAVLVEPLGGTHTRMFTRNIRETYRKEMGGGAEPSIELYQASWKSLPVIGYRLRHDRPEYRLYINAVRMPIRPTSIMIAGCCLAEHQRELDEIIRGLLASVEAEPSDWWPSDRPWTWAERGGEIAKAAAWLALSEVVVIFLWLRSRKRRTPAKAAG